MLQTGSRTHWNSVSHKLPSGEVSALPLIVISCDRQQEATHLSSHFLNEGYRVLAPADLLAESVPGTEVPVAYILQRQCSSELLPLCQRLRRCAPEAFRVVLCEDLRSGRHLVPFVADALLHSGSPQKAIALLNQMSGERLAGGNRREVIAFAIGFSRGLSVSGEDIDYAIKVGRGAGLLAHSVGLPAELATQCEMTGVLLVGLLTGLDSPGHSARVRERAQLIEDVPVLEGAAPALHSLSTLRDTKCDPSRVAESGPTVAAVVAGASALFARISQMPATLALERFTVEEGARHDPFVVQAIEETGAQLWSRLLL